MTWLWARNICSRAPVVGDVPVVVSLTTHGRRVELVHLALESIGRGRLRPARLILWIDEPDILAAPSLRLQRLVSRGLEILPTEDLGPHKKYFPALQLLDGSTWLATADDDVIYPSWWLDRLWAAARTAPAFVHCYRALDFGITAGGDPLPYEQWEHCKTRTASFATFPTGVSGVIYPPHVLRELLRRGTAFAQSAPRADDVWLHATTVATRTRIAQVADRRMEFTDLPVRDQVRLTDENVDAGGNDRQIAASYADSVLDLIRAEVMGRQVPS